MLARCRVWRRRRREAKGAVRQEKRRKVDACGVEGQLKMGGTDQERKGGAQGQESDRSWDAVQDTNGRTREAADALAVTPAPPSRVCHPRSVMSRGASAGQERGTPASTVRRRARKRQRQAQRQREKEQRIATQHLTQVGAQDHPNRLCQRGVRGEEADVNVSPAAAEADATPLLFYYFQGAREVRAAALSCACLRACWFVCLFGREGGGVPLISSLCFSRKERWTTAHARVHLKYTHTHTRTHAYWQRRNSQEERSRTCARTQTCGRYKRSENGRREKRGGTQSRRRPGEER